MGGFGPPPGSPFAGPGGQAFEQGRLAAAVLADQEGDAGPEIEALEGAEDRQGERKTIGLPHGAAATQPGEEQPGRGVRPAGTRPLHAARTPRPSAAPE